MMGASDATGALASTVGAFALGNLGSKIGPSAIESTFGTGTCIFGGVRCVTLAVGIALVAVARGTVAGPAALLPGAGSFGGWAGTAEAEEAFPGATDKFALAGGLVDSLAIADGGSLSVGLPAILHKENYVPQ